MTSAYFAVSVMNSSSHTKKSSARMTWPVSGSVRTGSSPNRNRPWIHPSIMAGKHSVAFRPAARFSSTPHAASNFARISGLATF